MSLLSRPFLILITYYYPSKNKRNLQNVLVLCFLNYDHKVVSSLLSVIQSESLSEHTKSLLLSRLFDPHTILPCHQSTLTTFANLGPHWVRRGLLGRDLAVARIWSIICHRGGRWYWRRQWPVLIGLSSRRRSRGLLLCQKHWWHTRVCTRQLSSVPSLQFTTARVDGACRHRG